MESTREQLIKRIMILNERVWERRIPQPTIDAWLTNFTGKVAEVEVERLHALFWLSQFLYYGSKEIRVLLRAMYRDLYFCPMVQSVRSKMPSGFTPQDLEAEVRREFDCTKFFGVGNPSESGIHLLYYFRQENTLAKDKFMDAAQIFSRGSSGKQTLRKPSIKRYVFLDDICGSGDTASAYSDTILKDLRDLKSDAELAYYCLFASSAGLARIRRDTLFSRNVAAVHELDETYRAFADNSRYFTIKYPDIQKDIAIAIAIEYGKLLDPYYACGYKNSQLLLGFHHNTPDNTLGIIWEDQSTHGTTIPWVPAFKRYPKVYGEV
jgi:hypothetical protein